MRTCDECGIEISPNRRRYCSTECSVRHNNQVVRAKRLMGLSTQELRERRGPCAHCNGPIPLTRRLGVRYCTQRCYKAATYNLALYRDRNKRKLYGISQAESLQLLEAQGGVCAICHTADWPDVTGKAGPHVDHDHTSGEVRGVLCQSCNHGLGKFKDDPERLRAAANYLDERQKK